MQFFDAAKLYRFSDEILHIKMKFVIVKFMQRSYRLDKAPPWEEVGSMRQEGKVPETKRIIVGTSGASRILCGVCCLQLLHDVEDVEMHAVIWPAALRRAQIKIDMTSNGLRAIPDAMHSFRDIGASIASGAFRTKTMLVALCSINALLGLVNCYWNQLLVREVDICLRVRRRLDLMLHETPLHAGHNVFKDIATRPWATIMPPVHAFYSQPTSLNQTVTHVVRRALDLFGIETGAAKNWKEQD